MSGIEMIALGDATLKSTEADMAVMRHMGKRQQLQRIFGFFPTLALSLTLLASWEALASGFAAGLSNGGPVVIVYGMILTIIGTLALAASLSEMASICPISGAQYHWTFLFAPSSAAAFITWMQGWITVFAKQATATSIVFLTATQIQGVIILNYDTYVPQGWHGTLLMWAVLLTLLVTNVWGIRFLPMIELIGGICHVVFYVMVLVTLVVLAPRSSASFVFTEFVNGGQWASDGVSWCVGLLTVVYCFVGFDGAIHMSEEVKDSATTIPKVIMLTILINGTLAFGFAICLLFTLGNIKEILSTNTGYPIIAIFYQATGSKAAATAMMAGIIIIAFSSGFALLASVSRLTFAFARDGGMPFSAFFAYRRHHAPVAVNIGSTIALYAVLSLSSLALYVSYLIPISLLVIKRLRKQEVQFGPFNLGRWGLWINLFAVAFGIFIIIFLPFPAQPNVDASALNWAGPLFGFLLLLALADWLFRGRFYYKGPSQEIGGAEELKYDNGVEISAQHAKSR
ncbi:hypothetical protein LTR91_019515 [Friedmanniomyces endolithicus]|uniref:Amino acid permease/ SLC12A domain-containing protein n=1 Tax=Friedmanniomyces endolithicus TaxID=329885 RepID=A0AAN6HB17_9PEZI|nr:hypothetical protein LTR03_014638 [Friedmanniomyces endolithicus]KAK0960530.1 hypothetical protein LTS01_020849 [Friedmanniomyces endolithicus]KAK0962301.1 hypothetical protein LTR91_019515 [Friedmanniomyces endolithicus]KAK1026102.1 hypothetical protein LTS16_022643 [Friedmanniomyces endolithicus]